MQVFCEASWLQSLQRCHLPCPAAGSRESRRESQGMRVKTWVGALTMAYAFDTLGYSKRLVEGGVPRSQAEAHAEAARDFVMAEVATKSDLALTATNLTLAMDNLALKLTIRVGSMIAGAIPLTVGALALLQHLAH
jgi:hypothetical protein